MKNRENSEWLPQEPQTSRACRRTLKSRAKASTDAASAAQSSPVQSRNCLSIALSCQLSLFITHTPIPAYVFVCVGNYAFIMKYSESFKRERRRDRERERGSMFRFCTLILNGPG